MTGQVNPVGNRRFVVSRYRNQRTTRKFVFYDDPSADYSSDQPFSDYEVRIAQQMQCKWARFRVLATLPISIPSRVLSNLQRLRCTTLPAARVVRS